MLLYMQKTKASTKYLSVTQLKYMPELKLFRGEVPEADAKQSKVKVTK